MIPQDFVIFIPSLSRILVLVVRKFSAFLGLLSPPFCADIIFGRIKGQLLAALNSDSKRWICTFTNKSQSLVVVYFKIPTFCIYWKYLRIKCLSFVYDKSCASSCENH